MYGNTYAVCGTCKKKLEKAPAFWDGEPTFVGYRPCSKHPHSETEYVVTVPSNEMDETEKLLESTEFTECTVCGHDHNDPEIAAFINLMFPRLFELETMLGEVLSWRNAAIGFYVGRGLSSEKAIDYALKLFPKR